MSVTTIADELRADQLEPWAGWASKLASFLEEWLAGFSWSGSPWTMHSLRVSCGALSVDLYGQPTALDPPRFSPEGRALALRMLETPWCDEWIAILEALCSGRLEGTWLHPDWIFNLDQLALAEGGTSLPIGCLDRRDPSLPRRFDSTKAAWAHNLGVVDFPLHSRDRCIQWSAEEVPPTRQAALLIGAALIEAAIHESLELCLRGPGEPWINPHRIRIYSCLELEVEGVRHVIKGRI